MGVTGSGKSTIGQMVADKLAIPFFDGDDFHPPANIDTLVKHRASGVIIACSALKETYRKLLAQNLQNELRFIYLEADIATIINRVKQRAGHFMPASLIQSQFDTLEVPQSALIVNIKLPKTELVQAILAKINQSMKQSTIGLIGLGVMGQSLARNFSNKGIATSVYNALGDFIQSLERPRKVFLMIKAGAPVDMVIEQLIPLLDADDIIIDGGNSHYPDTQRRFDYLKTKNIHFVGMGVSGGEKGALEGPSMMPGGARVLEDILLPIFRKVTAKTPKGEDCIHWMGEGGAGHFVKMVHNGIEYADMAMLSEAYFFMKKGLGMSNEAIGQQFEVWQDGELDGYLLQITAQICQHQEGDEYVLDEILDVAGNKGTGKWTVGSALDLGVPVPSLSAALFSRYISAFKDFRLLGSAAYEEGFKIEIEDKEEVLAHLEKALIACKMVSYAQGFHLLSAASDRYNWGLSLNHSFGDVGAFHSSI